MERILAALRERTIGTVIIVKLDRATRSVRDLGELLDLFKAVEADLVSVSEALDTSTAASRLVTNMLKSYGSGPKAPYHFLLAHPVETVRESIAPNRRILG